MSINTIIDNSAVLQELTNAITSSIVPVPGTLTNGGVAVAQYEITSGETINLYSNTYTNLPTGAGSKAFLSLNTSFSIVSYAGELPQIVNISWGVNGDELGSVNTLIYDTNSTFRSINFDWAITTSSDSVYVDATLVGGVLQNTATDYYSVQTMIQYS